MRHLVPALGIFLVGCAASSSSGPGEASPVEAPMDTPQVWALGEGYKEGRITAIQPDVDRVSNDIPAPPDAAFEALAEVYQEIGIEIAGIDAAARALNNPDLRISRRLGGERLSRYLSCGSGLTGAFADRFRIQMNILSQVTPGPEGTSVLNTTIQAFGVNPEGTSNTRVPCGSTYQLEYRIAEMVAEKVKG